jgi:diguanylate cyclase (GGDEF)-like protein
MGRLVTIEFKNVNPIGIALDQETLHRENLTLRARIVELERQVACDSLTSLYNRRYFLAELNRWSWRVRRYGGQYGLLYIDADDLKPINDMHGHGAGDAVLTAIAQTLRENVRKSDIAARIGGDEFAILLDTISPDDLAGRSVRLVEAVKELRIPYRGQLLTTQISIGHTMIESGVRPEDLILRADRAMYEAKAAKG